MKNTLFLIQSEYINTPAQLERLRSLYQPNDGIVLMNDAVLYANLINDIQPLYVIENEKLLLTEQFKGKVINYDVFASLVLDYNKIIRLG